MMRQKRDAKWPLTSHWKEAARKVLFKSQTCSSQKSQLGKEKFSRLGLGLHCFHSKTICVHACVRARARVCVCVCVCVCVYISSCWVMRFLWPLKSRTCANGACNDAIFLFQQTFVMRQHSRPDREFSGAPFTLIFGSRIHAVETSEWSAWMQ